MTKSLKRAFVVGLLALVSCTSDNDPASNDTTGVNAILPLKVGNQWILQATYSDTTQPGLDTMRITKDTLIDGERWFFIEGAFFGPNQPLMTNRSNGLWTRNNLSMGLSWKYPSFVGDAYPIGSGGTDTIHVVSTTADVSVPAGPFRCYRYRFNSDTSDTYLSPNVGFVKFPEFGVTDSSGPTILRTVRLELLRAVLN